MIEVHEVGTTRETADHTDAAAHKRLGKDGKVATDVLIIRNLLVWPSVFLSGWLIYFAASALF